MLKRIYNLVKGFFLSILGKAEASNPKAILEAEKENLRGTIKKFDDALVKHRSKVIGSQEKKEKLQKQEVELKKKAIQLHNAGHSQLAGKVARDRSQAAADLEEILAFLVIAESQYEDLVNQKTVAVQAAKDAIEEVSRNIDQAELHSSMAEITEMTKDFGDELSNSGLSRLAEITQNAKNEAMARSEISENALESSDYTTSKEFRQMDENAALADLLSSEGIEMEKAEPAKPLAALAPLEPVASTMGPAPDPEPVRTTVESSPSSYESGSSYDSSSSSDSYSSD